MSGPSFAPFAWRPSPQRTIVLFDYAGGAPRDRLPAALPLRWPDKPTVATLDYAIDARALLVGADDAISGVVNAAGNLSLLATLAQSGLFILWFAGGAGVDNVVDLTLTTLSTRRVHRIVRLMSAA